MDNGPGVRLRPGTQCQFLPVPSEALLALHPPFHFLTKNTPASGIPWVSSGANAGDMGSIPGPGRYHMWLGS